MSLLIKRATVVDPDSPFHGQEKDILIENGIIAEVSDSIDLEKGMVVTYPNLKVSRGWLDLHVDFADPGNEDQESIETGLECAAAGGFTGVGLVPSTQPVLDSKADIEYVLGKSSNSPCQIFPLGAATKGLEGKELTEMHDMKSAGAFGFTNDFLSNMKADMLELVMRYAHSVQGVFFFHPEEISLNQGGQMHEGMISTRMGLKGMPLIAEEIALQTCLKLAGYNKIPVHIMGLSSKSGLEIIKEAREQGAEVTCDVNVMNLVYTEEDLLGYPTEFKLRSPLRCKEDREALVQGVLDGSIESISSDHRPVREEGKNCEFDLADFGAIGLQTCYNLCLKAFAGKDLEKWLPALYRGGEHVFNLEPSPIEKGEYARLSLFSDQGDFKLNRETNLSKSKNSPVWNQSLKGEVYGIVNGRDYYLKEN